MAATIRENLLVAMGMYAGEMDQDDEIDIPSDIAGEDELADFCVECVDDYLKYAYDIPFDEYAVQCLSSKYGRPNYCVIASYGTVDKVLMTGTHEECKLFCEENDWEWSEVPGGFVWDLEVEEI